MITFFKFRTMCHLLVLRSNKIQKRVGNVRIVVCRKRRRIFHLHFHLLWSKLYTMANTQNKILNLYRNLIRECKKWNAYNFRMYALRKVRYEFQQNKMLQDEREIEQCFKKGQEALEMIKRQVIIGHLYATRPLIIETTTASKNKLNSKFI